jgi:hypothetical protein
MRLLSSKASRRVSWVCFDDKIGACFGESCLDYQVHSFVGHRAWISPLLVSFACFQINRRIFVLTQQSALHSCLTSLPLMVLQDAIGFARSCQYFLRESSGLALALWMEVLDILRNALSPCPATCTTSLSPFLLSVKIERGLWCRTPPPSMSSHPSIRGRTGKGIQPESRDVLKRFRTGQLHTFECLELRPRQLVFLAPLQSCHLRLICFIPG